MPIAIGEADDDDADIGDGVCVCARVTLCDAGSGAADAASLLSSVYDECRRNGVVVVGVVVYRWCVRCGAQQ